MKYLIAILLTFFSINAFAAKTKCDHVYDQVMYMGESMVEKKSDFNTVFGEILFERIDKLPWETKQIVIWSVVQVPKIMEENGTQDYKWVARSSYSACRQS